MLLYNKLFVEFNLILVKWVCKELGFVVIDMLCLLMILIIDSGCEMVRVVFKYVGLL